MTAPQLRREIETALGLGPTQGASLWREAAAMRPVPAPGSPVPVSRPDIAAAKPAVVAGTGRRFDGQYYVTGVQHQFGDSGQRDVLTLRDLLVCVSAAVEGDAAAARIWPLWVRLRNALAAQPAALRMQLGHELTHTVQQRRE